MHDLLYFVRLFKPHKTLLFLGAFLALLTMLANLGLLTVSGWFITASALAGLAALDGAYSFNMHHPSGAIRGLAIFRTLSRYAERVVTHDATFRALADLRAWLFAKLIPLAPAKLQQYRSGDLLNRLTNDIDTLDNLYLRMMVPSFVALVAMIGFAIFMGFYLLPAALCLLVMIALSGFALPYWATKRGAASGRHMLLRTAQLRTNMIDVFQGLADLQANQADGRHLRQLSKDTQSLIRAQSDQHHVQALTQAANMLIGGKLLWFIILLGIPHILDKTLGPAHLAMLVLGAMAALEGVAPLAASFQQYGKTQLAAQRLRETAEDSPAFAEPTEPKAYPETLEHIQFNHVSLTYPNREDAALSGLTLTIPAGQKLALIGDSGSGKSSLMSLLMRIRPSSAGSIYLNDTDIAHIPTDQMMAAQGFMEQKVHLFNASLRDNLKIAAPKATDAELIEALEQVDLGSLLQTLPNGLDSWMGDQGSHISGGQARRVALARLVLAKDTKLWLLDEPTEGLDAATEAEILDLIDRLSVDRTLIMATHRKSCLKRVERVLQFDQGRLLKDIPQSEIEKLT